MTWEPPNSISPSRLSLYRQCPLRFRVETIQKMPGETNASAVAGTACHTALERLLALPGPERTRERLAEIIEEVLVEIRDDPQFQSLTDEQIKTKGFDAFVRRVAPRAFDMVDLPALQLAGIELSLEVELDGWIMRGIIDVLEWTSDGLLVGDWKSGRTPGQRYQRKAMEGIHFYATMIEILTGEIPARASLYYIDSRTTLSVEPNRQTVNAVKSKVLATRDAILHACETDSFRPSTSALCDWCGVKPYCPAHGGDIDEVPVELGKGRVDHADANV